MAISAETRARLGRHTGTVMLVLALCAGLKLTGVFPAAVPIWAMPVAIVLGATASVVAYTRWGRSADLRGMRLRVAIQGAVMTGITYTTGWGFALPLAHLFSIADNVKYSGSRSVDSVIRAAIAWTIVAQTLLSMGAIPSVHPRVFDTWAIAALMLVAVAVVAKRIQRVTMGRERAEAQLRGSEARFRSLVEDSSDVILVLADGIVKYQSPSAKTVLGYDFETIDGSAYLEWVHPEDRAAVLGQVRDMLDDSSAVSRLIECRVLHGDGHWITVETSTRNLSDDSLVGGFVLNIRDVTERKRLEEQLEHRAFHDALTGLPNRALFHNRVEHLVARASRAPVEAAVLYLDLDGFKVVNDSLGHGCGDEVLVAAATRIAAAIRGADTAARLGGDEFAVLLEGFDKEEGPARVAERVLASLREPLTVAGIEINIDASIGIALLREGWTADELTRNADIAMYMAKAAGKGCYEMFEPQMHVSVVERLNLERDLHRGIEAGEFELHYQPIVELDTGRAVGVEALARWNHPTRGMVSPGQFIPVAEETGLVIPLGRWVLHEACRQMSEWQTRFPHRPALHVSINVSMKQLSHGDIVADTTAALKASAIDPSTVTLELTESALVNDTERTVKVLHQLKALGVRLAIDDFGTGYSSLSYLQRFPIDVLKIDRSFVEGMVNGKQSPALVRAIIEMSHSLNLETVAEGIEHDEELSRVRALQCRLGQGYLFARPADRGEVERLMARTAERTIILDEVTRKDH